MNAVWCCSPQEVEGQRTQMRAQGQPGLSSKFKANINCAARPSLRIKKKERWQREAKQAGPGSTDLGSQLLKRLLA